MYVCTVLINPSMSNRLQTAKLTFKFFRLCENCSQSIPFAIVLLNQRPLTDNILFYQKRDTLLQFENFSFTHQNKNKII